MDELNRLIANLIKEKGGSRNDYLTLLDAISFHESGGSMDPKTIQRGGGPGRGLFQFEEGEAAGGITAAKRTKQYLDSIGEEVPEWLQEASAGKSLNAANLSREQQQMLFLGNMRMHPRADMGKVVKGEQSIPEFWADNHWAGPRKDRRTRLKSFNRDYKDFQTIMEGKEYVSDWFKDPETLKRYQENTGKELNEAYWDVAKGLSNVDKARIGRGKSDNPNNVAEYKGDKVTFFKQPDVGTSTHEFTHATGDIDNELSTFIRRKWGAIPFDDMDMPSERRSKSYINSPGELYPRFMEMRQYLNAKPGDVIEDSQIEKLQQNKETSQMFNFYKPDVIKEILNTVADTSTSNITNVAAHGGAIKGMKHYDTMLNSYNTGGSHESNPYGGVPIGMGTNGKMNTVEQGETSMKVKDGAYIFSNRLTLAGKIKQHLT